MEPVGLLSCPSTPSNSVSSRRALLVEQPCRGQRPSGLAVTTAHALPWGWACPLSLAFSHVPPLLCHVVPSKLLGRQARSLCVALG